MTLADTLQVAPAHWQRQRAKVFLREVDERSATGSEELLSVSHLTGVTPRSQKNVTMFKAASYSGHKRCEPGDLVINTLWAWMGALGVSKHPGLVSPAYGIYRCRNTWPAFNPSYLDYLARTPIYVAEYVRRSTGIQSSRLRLYPEQFLDIPLLLPPRDEQDQIVAFLRAQDVKLGRLVRVKQQLHSIAMDRAHGQWHRMLSGAGASDGPISLEWPPNSESRWPLKRLKHVSRQVSDQCVTQADDERYVALENVASWTGSLSAPAGPVAFTSTVKRFAQDDLLFGKLRPYLAKVARPSFKGVCVSEFIVLRARTDVIEPAFLALLSQSCRPVHPILPLSSGEQGINSLHEIKWVPIDPARRA